MATPHTIVVIGDCGSGKTALLHRYLSKKWCETFEPSTIDRHSTYIQMTNNDVTLKLMLWDTAGSKDFQRLRSLAYRHAHTIMLCFSVENHDGYDNVLKYWLKEIQRFGAGSLPILLVGTKVDLRDSVSVRERKDTHWHIKPISFGDGLKLAHKIGAVKYVECSALRGYGLSVVFQELALIGLRCRPELLRKHSKCGNCQTM